MRMSHAHRPAAQCVEAAYAPDAREAVHGGLYLIARVRSGGKDGRGADRSGPRSCRPAASLRIPPGKGGGCMGHTTVPRGTTTPSRCSGRKTSHCRPAKSSSSHGAALTKIVTRLELDSRNARSKCPDRSAFARLVPRQPGSRQAEGGAPLSRDVPPNRAPPSLGSTEPKGEGLIDGLDDNRGSMIRACSTWNFSLSTSAVPPTPSDTIALSARALGGLVDGSG